MHAALEQRLGFARRVQVVGDFLVVDLERDRVEREELADVHRDEHRDLGVGREQQLFLEHEQVAVEVDDVFLEVLDVFVERARVGRRLAAIPAAPARPPSTGGAIGVPAGASATAASGARRAPRRGVPARRRRGAAGPARTPAARSAPAPAGERHRRRRGMI